LILLCSAGRSFACILFGGLTLTGLRLPRQPPLSEDEEEESDEEEEVEEEVLEEEEEELETHEGELQAEAEN
jgi:hypothetical protein